MDILSQGNSQTKFNKKIYVNEGENIAKEKESVLDGNKIDRNVFRLNPLLHESLNNLVKRLEKTKIPKQPPTKGQSIRKKSKLSNSLPNIFLPPGFDDHKYSNNEKKVQWTNKLNLNLERLKTAFNDTYNLWCDKKRSLSISNLEIKCHNTVTSIVPEICNNDLNFGGDISSTLQKNVYGDEIMATQKPFPKFNSWGLTNVGTLDPLSKVVIASNHPVSEFEEIPSYSTHVYLDGAIIEPISPASPDHMTDQMVHVPETVSDNIVQDTVLPEIQSDLIIQPVIRKKGRPKKIQQPLVNVKPLEILVPEVENKSVKVPKTKKRNKSQKAKGKNDERPSFSSDTTEDNSENTLAENITKPSLTKRQKKLAKQNELNIVGDRDLMSTIESISVDNSSEKAIEPPILAKKGRKNSRQNKAPKSKNQTLEFSEVALLSENVPKQSPIKKLRRSSKLTANNTDECPTLAEILPEKADGILEIVSSVNLSEKSSDKVDQCIDSAIPINCDDVPETSFDTQTIEIAEKSILTKKQRKSSKQLLLELDNIPETDDTNKSVENNTLTKKQKQLLKKTTSSKDVDVCQVENNTEEKIVEDVNDSNKDICVSEENTETVKLDNVSEPHSKVKTPRKLAKQNKPLDSSQTNDAVDKDLIEVSSQKEIGFSVKAHLDSDVEVLGGLSDLPSKMMNIEKDPRTKSPRKLSRQNLSVGSIQKDIEHFELHVEHRDNVIVLKPEESILMKIQNELKESFELKKQCDEPSLNVESTESTGDKLIVTKLNKRGLKRISQINPIEEVGSLPELDRSVENVNVSKACQGEKDFNALSNNTVDEESIPIDKRRRLQRKNQKPSIDSIIQNTEVEDKPLINIVNEVPKKGTKVKIGPKSKKQLFKLDENPAETIAETITETLPTDKSKVAQKFPKRGRPKSDEHYDEDLTVDPIMDSLPDESCKEVVDNIPDYGDSSTCEKVEVDDVLKSDPPPIIDQSNDIEVLSKSITDSVDTSMLPPRKRYKRLMYLDNTKQASPKEIDIVDIMENVELCKLDNQSDLPKDDEEFPSKKVTNFRSRLKRKKPTKAIDDIVETMSSDSVPVDIPSSGSDQVKEEVIPDKELVIAPLIDEGIDKPSSLKRSKREAAARGFANMVAMSLNNSSQSHDTSSDFTKKSSSSKPDSADETLADVSGSKMFKKPRKANLTTIGISKNKGKLSKSFDFADENDDDSEDIETSNVLTKKQRIFKEKSHLLPIKENPPSPCDTIISNDSSGQDVSKYRKIRTNIYVDSKPGPGFYRVEKCGCKSSTIKNLDSEPRSTTDVVWDCSDECLNRLNFVECISKTCPTGDLCRNQKIRKLEWAPGLNVIDLPAKGRGVISTKSISVGTFLAEYVGEVISEKKFQERLMSIYKDEVHQYCLHFDSDMVIDAYRSGSIARFVNHSCQPNCDIQKWLVNGNYRLCLFANEDIGPEIELTFDYNFWSFNTKTTQICVCGASNCRGFIGGRPQLEQSDQGNDRKKLLFAFGRMMPRREKLFILRRSIFMFRDWIIGRCRRLGRRRTKRSHGLRLPSTVSEIKRRNAKNNEFLTQMSTLNSIRTIRTSLLESVSTQLGWVLRDLYNSLLEQKDPLNPSQQLVAPFIKGLNHTKYPEFYNMVGHDSVVCLEQVYYRLLDGKYTTMMAFDQDILQMIQNVELYAGKQSNIGKCAEQMKPIYKDLKMNAIALYESLTEEMVDDRDKNKLLSNNLTQITNAVKSLSNNTELDQSESTGSSRGKKRKPGSVATTGGSRGRLERGAEVIKCVCGFLIEAGHVMVQCDQCFVWQHAYCMNVARSSDLVDVTRIEPYHCHICLDIPTESLIREIPRHFVITDETVASGNTLFWTLLHTDMSLLKIDDFVYIPSDDNVENLDAIDLSQRTIMRIYSLWKDCDGQRWMEGGLFLRPYNGYLKSLSESRTVTSDSHGKRKASTVMDLSTHKWHQQEVVYTDLTKILPLAVCVGRCYVLNTHTFRLGKPLSETECSVSVEDVYLCDWLINKSGQWSEIDPSYMKINTKPYCFERFTDVGVTEGTNEKFLRQYTVEELLKFDQRVTGTCGDGNLKIKSYICPEEKSQQFEKLISKISEFAFDRNRQLHVSAPSRDASPSGEISQPLTHTHNRSRKQSLPRKALISVDNSPATINFAKACSDDSKSKTPIASEYSESSPKLMIVVEEEKVPKKSSLKVSEEYSPMDDKSSDLVSSSTKDNLEDRSNPCSEIKYGDLLDLLKDAVPCKVKPKSKVTRVSQAKGKKKIALKKNALKPVSEINSVDDNWIPSGSQLDNNAPRRETRSRKTIVEEKIVPQESIIEENEESSKKTCFVKLERMRVSRAEKSRLKKAEQDQNTVDSIGEAPHSLSTAVPNCSFDKRSPDKKLDSQISLDQSKSGNLSQQTIQIDGLIGTDDDTQSPNFSSVTGGSNRSKRKKGVPKRIPFDFPYQAIGSAPKPDESGSVSTYDYEVVDLSAGKSCQVDKPDQATTDCQKIESPESLALAVSKLPKANSTATETRHITAANDFSSIENISSN